jgi:hypothetical protein
MEKSLHERIANLSEVVAGLSADGQERSINFIETCRRGRSSQNGTK